MDVFFDVLGEPNVNIEKASNIFGYADMNVELSDGDVSDTPFF